MLWYLEISSRCFKVLMIVFWSNVALCSFRFLLVHDYMLQEVFSGVDGPWKVKHPLQVTCFSMLLPNFIFLVMLFCPFPLSIPMFSFSCFDSIGHCCWGLVGQKWHCVLLTLKQRSWLWPSFGAYASLSPCSSSCWCSYIYLWWSKRR